MNIKLKLIKILDVFLLGNIYMFLGCIISSFFKKYICKPYDNKKNKYLNLLQLFYEIGLVMIVVYFIRIFIKYYLPNPLNGIYGFNAKEITEINGGIILAFAFLLYIKDPVKSKINKLYDWFK